MTVLWSVNAPQSLPKVYFSERRQLSSHFGVRPISKSATSRRPPHIASGLQVGHAQVVDMGKAVSQPVADSTIRVSAEGSGHVRYRMLGSLDVRRDDEVLDLGVYKQRALLALLLINANNVVSTDRIIDELWGDTAGRDRQSALWTVVSRLRSVLEPEREKRTDGTILLTRPPGYLLSVDDGDVDAGDRSLAWNHRNVSGYFSFDDGTTKHSSDLNLSGTVDATDRSLAWNNRNKTSLVPVAP